MNDIVIDQLDESIGNLLVGRKQIPGIGSDLRALLQVASELRSLPRPAFRAQLRSDLLTSLERRGTSPAGAAKPPRDIPRTRESLPLFSPSAGTFPVRGVHLAVSFALHVAALAVVLTSGWWMVKNRTSVSTRMASRFSETVEYILPSASDASHGGGGGGDHDKMQASRGTAPGFSSQQLTPPTAVIRNQDPALAAEPTVIGPPDIVLPESDKNGDPMAAILNPPSNGTGSGGGIGIGDGGGIGMGHGPGVGDGSGGGIGGGVYRVGGAVSAPRAVYDPDPEYSEEARKAKYQGSVVLWVIIGPDGRPRNVRISRSLGMGLDEKAIDAVSKWRFEPALRDGHPVTVQVNIEVAFRLY